MWERKIAEKELRKIQRIEAAKKRHQIYTDIMKADNEDKHLFYKLIKLQREGKINKLSKLVIDDVHLTDDNDIREGWSKYFGVLSSVSSDPRFDNEYRDRIDRDIIYTEKREMAERNNNMIIDIDTIKTVVKGMKNGKSPDGDVIMMEHLKYGGTALLSNLQILFSKIIQEQKIPEKFKNGIITPIYKKQNKPIKDPNSYRRITVASNIGKIFEKLHLNAIIDQVEELQSNLQRGFTKGTSPLYAALLLTESIAEAQDRRIPLYAAFLDASKAFDVVWHNSILKKTK